MPSLSSLAQIPGYGAYIARRQMNEEQPIGQLKQVGALMQIQQQMQAKQEQQELRSVMSQTGGNPEQAIKALITAGTPQSIALAEKLKGFVPKPPEAYTLPPGAQRRDPSHNIVAQADFKPEAPKPFGDVHNVPGGYITKDESGRNVFSRTQPQSQGISVYTGSSDTVQGADGRFYKFRVGKDGTTEAVPIQTTGGDPLRPPETATERKDRLAEVEATTDIGQIERLGNELNGLVQENQGLFKGVVGPQGYIGRILDLAAGPAGASTPAIDFANKSKLFLSSVRKMVEKDANLSNQERTSLLESIGVGFWQTGTSSIRARNDVMTYVRAKRIGDLKGGQVPPTNARVVGQTYQTPRGPMKWTGTGWLPAN